VLGRCFAMSAVIVVAGSLITGSLMRGVADAAPKGDRGKLGVRVERTGTKTASLLFAVDAGAGTFTPRPGETKVFELTLTGIAPRTVWFTNRPARQADSVPTADALTMIGFGPGDSPPNAVVDVKDADSANDAIAVKLEDPAYDAVSATLTLTATALDKPRGKSRVAGFGPRLDTKIPSAFGEASLFIDDADTPIADDGTPELKEYTVYAAIIMNFGQPASGTLEVYQGTCYNGTNAGPFTDIGDGKEHVITMVASESFPSCFGTLTNTRWVIHVTSPVDQSYRLQWGEDATAGPYTLFCQDPDYRVSTKPLTCTSKDKIRVVVSP
jgi:hypothetical protein